MSDVSHGALGIGALALIIAFAGIVVPIYEDNELYGKLLTGNLADRPDPYILDRWFYANDTEQLFYDNGTAWIEVPLGDGGGGGGSLLNGQTYLAGIFHVNAFIWTTIASISPTTQLCTVLIQGYSAFRSAVLGSLFRFRFNIDDVAGNQLVLTVTRDNSWCFVSFWNLENVSAGSHTFELQAFSTTGGDVATRAIMYMELTTSP